MSDSQLETEKVVNHFSAMFKGLTNLSPAFLREVLKITVTPEPKFYIVDFDLYKETVQVGNNEFREPRSVPEAMQLYKISFWKNTDPLSKLNLYASIDGSEIKFNHLRELLSYYGAVFRPESNGVSLMFPGFSYREYIFFSRSLEEPESENELPESVIYPVGSDTSTDINFSNSKIRYSTKYYHGTEYGIFFTQTTSHNACWCISQNLELFNVFSNSKTSDGVTTTINRDPSRYPLMDMVIKFVATTNTGPKQSNERFCSNFPYINVDNIFRIVCSGYTNSILGIYSSYQQHNRLLPNLHVYGTNRDWRFFEIKDFLSRVIVSSEQDKTKIRSIQSLRGIADLIERNMIRDSIFRTVMDNGAEYISIYSKNFTSKDVNGHSHLSPDEGPMNELLRIALIRTTNFRKDFLENLKLFTEREYVSCKGSSTVIYKGMIPKICNSPDIRFKLEGKIISIEENFDQGFCRKNPSVSFLISLASFTVNNISYDRQHMFIFTKSLIYYWREVNNNSSYKAIIQNGSIANNAIRNLEFIIFKCLRFVASAERVDVKDDVRISVGDDWLYDLNKSTHRKSTHLYGSRRYFEEIVRAFFKHEDFRSPTVYRVIRQCVKEIRGYEGFRYDQSIGFYRGTEGIACAGNNNVKATPLYLLTRNDYLSAECMQYVANEFKISITPAYVNNIHNSILSLILSRIEKHRVPINDEEDLKKQLESLWNERESVKIEKDWPNLGGHIKRLGISGFDAILTKFHNHLTRFSRFLAFNNFDEPKMLIMYTDEVKRELDKFSHENQTKIVYEYVGYETGFRARKPKFSVASKLEDNTIVKETVISRVPANYFDYVFDREPLEDARIFRNTNILVDFVTTSDFVFGLYNGFRTLTSYDEIVKLRNSLREHLQGMRYGFDGRIMSLRESIEDKKVFNIYDVCELDPNKICFDVAMINSISEKSTEEKRKHVKDTTLQDQTLKDLANSYEGAIRAFKIAFEKDFTERNISPLYNMYWIMRDEGVMPEMSRIDIVKRKYFDYENASDSLKGNFEYDLISYAKSFFHIYYSHSVFPNRNEKISFNYEQSFNIKFVKVDEPQVLSDSKYLPTGWDHLSKTNFKISEKSIRASPEKISIDGYTIVKRRPEEVNAEIKKLLSTVLRAMSF